MDSTEKECFAHIHRFLLLSLNQKPKRSIAHGNILSPLLLLIAGVGSVCTGSVKFIKHGVGERRVEVMAEDKAGKAIVWTFADIVANLEPCPFCNKKDGLNPLFDHKTGKVNVLVCTTCKVAFYPAGAIGDCDLTPTWNSRPIKVATVELEEMC